MKPKGNEGNGMGRGQFHGIQVRLLGDDFVNIRLEAGVCVEEFLAESALDGGFDF